MNRVKKIFTVSLLMALAAVYAKPLMPAETKRKAASNKKNEAKPNEQIYNVPPPPFSKGIFPCSNCHADMKPDLKQRRLTEEHTNIKLEHGKKWCFTCHNPGNRDYLRLADGTLVPFERSYELCGECHGPNLRDWKLGIHGQTTGEWNGKKQYLLCAHCHNPHSPRFKPLKPMPPPVRPENLGEKK